MPFRKAQEYAGGVDRTPCRGCLVGWLLWTNEVCCFERSSFRHQSVHVGTHARKRESRGHPMPHLSEHQHMRACVYAGSDVLTPRHLAHAHQWYHTKVRSS
eukprot:scaffold83107_cov33-Tisochrysis_lutea.AAC.3